MFKRIHGFLPPFMLQELAARMPEDPSFLNTLVETQKLFAQRAHRGNPYFRFVGAGKSPIHVYDARNGYSRPGHKARFDGDSACGIEDADNIYDYSDHFRRFLLEAFGRNGIDASGMKLVSTVRYGRNYNNAYWDGSQMTYGTGDGKIFRSFALLDVHGHECGHGETEFAANGNFVYYGQPGALNEHLSDVRGELLEQYVLNQTVDQARWVVGDGIFAEGINGVGIRHMLHPGTAYNDRRLGKDPQPAKMSDYWKGSGDNGGVHYNSGIPNRAFALFALEVGGYAWEIPGKIWYAARATSPYKPSFARFAHETIEACKALGFGKYEQPLREAWKAVELEPNAKAVDTDTPADPAFEEEAIVR